MFRTGKIRQHAALQNGTAKRRFSHDGESGTGGKDYRLTYQGEVQHPCHSSTNLDAQIIIHEYVADFRCGHRESVQAFAATPDHWGMAASGGSDVHARLRMAIGKLYMMSTLIMDKG